MDTEHLTLPFEIKAEEKADSVGMIEGYASTFGNVDLVGDIIAPEAFDNSIKQFRKDGYMPLLWAHDARTIIGVVNDLRKDEKGLRFKAQFALATTAGRDAYELARMGAVRKLSIGFVTRDYELDGDKRILKDIELKEISLVAFPANPQADVTAVKAVVPYQDLPLADRNRPWNAAAAVRRVREWAGAQDAPNSRYRRAFVWYDESAPDNFGSYKLPIADVIDGTLTAVPRAIFAAAAAVMGARGGVNIPESDLPGVRRHLSRYYRKMDETPPWEKRGSLGVDERKALVASLDNVRDVEAYLREVGFSRRAATAMASTWKACRDGGDEGQGNADEIVSSLRELIAAMRGG